MRDGWRTIWRWLPLPLLLAVSVSSCRVAERTAQVRTEYVYKYQRDSVYIDCTDTVFVVQRGDTVTILEKRTEREYYYTIYRDTLRTSDTLIVEKVRVEREKAKKNGGKMFLFGLLSALFVIFAAKLVVRFIKKKY